VMAPLRPAPSSAPFPYTTLFRSETTSRGVPFSPLCQRRENGNVMASNPDAEPGSMASLDCKTQFDTGFQVIVTDIRERRFEVVRSEEHTSELQSRENLVCRLLLE